MALSNELIECVICNETLSDPRALPCGHSFCGPPRDCLSALESVDGGLRCAICRVDHNLSPGKIKPLYGIREYIQKSLEGNIRDSYLSCSVHPDKEYTFWCSNCYVMVCDDCIEYQHDDHPIRKLKRYLVEKIEEQLGESLLQGFAKVKTELMNAIISRKQELELSKYQVACSERELDEMLSDQVAVDQYDEISKNSCRDTLRKETDLLARISNSKIIKKLGCSQGYVTCKSKIDGVERSTISTQTEVSVASVSTSTALSTISRSTETSESCLSPTDTSPPMSKTDSSDVLVDCNCGAKHKMAKTWSSPITMRSLVYIIQRNPFKAAAQSGIVCCPFQFYFAIELVSQINARRHKMVRITVQCQHTFSKQLPSFTFEYKLFLVNAKNRDKSLGQTGKWVYPKEEKLVWDPLPYPELLNPELGWISDNECIEIQFRLMA